MTFIPLGNNIIIQALQKKEENPLGLIIERKEVYKEGEIVAISRTVTELSIGDKVLYTSGNSLTIEGKPYILLTLKDIMGVLE